mmetsp:Transcript_37376/g.60191  ORF Transcript_37376/g.60191 Transcript_37376/m.60191 type:complete len:206 (-) Transcript_37376:97-714(-)
MFVLELIPVLPRHRVLDLGLHVGQALLSRALAAIQAAHALLEPLLLPRHLNDQLIISRAHLALFGAFGLDDSFGHVLICLQQNDATFGLDQPFLELVCAAVFAQGPEALERGGCLGALDIGAILLFRPLLEKLCGFCLERLRLCRVLLVQEHLLHAQHVQVLLVALELRVHSTQLVVFLAHLIERLDEVGVELTHLIQRFGVIGL